jgi:hypothetical protein
MIYQLPVRHRFDYEPSRSTRGVAHVEFSAKRGVPNTAIQATALHELDKACREQHGHGLPSTEPNDHRFIHYCNEVITNPDTGWDTMLAKHRIEKR